MACSWSVDENNVEGKDFKLFSTLNDAFGDHSLGVCVGLFGDELLR